MDVWFWWQSFGSSFWVAQRFSAAIMLLFDNRLQPLRCTTNCTTHSLGSASRLRHIRFLSMLRGLFLIGENLLVLFRRSIQRIQRVAQNKFVLLRLFRWNAWRIFQRAQLGLEF